MTRLFTVLLMLSGLSALAGDRAVAHVTASDSVFFTTIIISNPSAEIQDYGLEPYDLAGEPLDRADGSIAPGQSQCFTPEELFGSEFVSHFYIDDIGEVFVEIVYGHKERNVSPAHVSENKQRSRRWRVYPGSWRDVVDGLAVVNPGNDLLNVFARQVDKSGDVLGVEMPIQPGGIAPNGKLLYLFQTDFDEQPDTYFELIGDSAFYMTALRFSIGDEGLTYLWENRAVPLTMANTAPEITDQRDITINEDAPYTISLDDFTIVDPDNDPIDFSISILDGPNYTREGLTITPLTDFTGTILVPVTISDGISSSAVFNLEIEVVEINDIPLILGQNRVVTLEEVSVGLTLLDLVVEDSDGNYPIGYTLTLQEGEDFTFLDRIVTPALDFNGVLRVPVTVTDPQGATSAPFNMRVSVDPVNDKPVVLGQEPLITPEGTPLIIRIEDLQIGDPDNDFPDDFTLTVLDGLNYTRTRNTITPVDGFVFTLTVPCRVSDGQDESDIFNLAVAIGTPGVGRQAVLSDDRGLGISGTAVVINGTTIQITNFNYNGGADFGRWVLAVDGDFHNGLAVGDFIGVNSVFEDETVFLNLPNGETTSDYNSIALWDVIFTLEYASGTFE